MGQASWPGAQMKTCEPATAIFVAEIGSLRPSCNAVPHAHLLHEERAASALHEQPPAPVGSSVDDADAPQDQAAAATHVEGARPQRRCLRLNLSAFFLLEVPLSKRRGSNV